MNKTLLVLFILFFGLVKVDAQVPPPPCGLTPVLVCDNDLDGQVIVDLTEKFPFSYCNVNPNQAPNYTMSYYLTEDDANNATNVIIDPENFLFESNEVILIYRRADANDSNSVLIASDDLKMVNPPTPNFPNRIILCDSNGNGFNEFNLNERKYEILAGESNSNYQVQFYESFTDASNLVNPISTPTEYTNTVPYLQTIYASVSVQLENDPALACVEVVDFDLVVQEDCQDLSVQLLNPEASPRPGFAYDNILLIKNEGTQSIPSGTVEFEYDTNLIFNSASSPDISLVITNTASGFNADFSNLGVGESILIDINFTCSTSVPLGTLITNVATYTTTTEDVNAFNDVFELREIVIGAYDPNDKMESHGPEIDYDEFVTSDEYLYYTIRFQNVGTAEAIDVRIEDVLDSQINPSTFEIISWSHPNTVLREGDKLTWTFQDINLPAEQDDPEGSNGYVFFRIKPNPGYAIGDIIPNSASIFFDFNAPIITNVFNTEFVRNVILDVEEVDYNNFTIFPNPSDGKLNIRLNQFNQNIRLEILDVNGRIILVASELESDLINIDLSAHSKGMYFVKLINNQLATVKKFFVN